LQVQSSPLDVRSLLKWIQWIIISIAENVRFKVLKSFFSFYILFIVLQCFNSEVVKVNKRCMVLYFIGSQHLTRNNRTTQKNTWKKVLPCSRQLQKVYFSASKAQSIPWFVARDRAWYRQPEWQYHKATILGFASYYSQIDNNIRNCYYINPKLRYNWKHLFNSTNQRSSFFAEFILQIQKRKL